MQQLNRKRALVGNPRAYRRIAAASPEACAAARFPTRSISCYTMPTHIIHTTQTDTCHAAMHVHLHAEVEPFGLICNNSHRHGPNLRHKRMLLQDKH